MGGNIIKGTNIIFVHKLFWVVTFSISCCFWCGNMVQNPSRRAESICVLYIFRQDCLGIQMRMFCDVFYNLVFFDNFWRLMCPNPCSELLIFPSKRWFSKLYHRKILHKIASIFFSHKEIQTYFSTVFTINFHHMYIFSDHELYPTWTHWRPMIQTRTENVILFDTICKHPNLND